LHNIYPYSKESKKKWDAKEKPRIFVGYYEDTKGSVDYLIRKIKKVLLET